MIALGRLGAPHGVQGWVRLRSDTDPADRIFDYREWTLRQAGETRIAKVIGTRRFNDRWLVKLEGLDDRDAAALLSGAEVCVARGELPATAAKEFYRADLVGFRAFDEGGNALGTLAYFVETAAHAVMVIAGEREVWVPAVAKHLRRVDLQARTVVVRVLDTGEQE